MPSQKLLPRIWHRTKRIFVVLFIAQLIYIVLLKWVNPPLTMTQLVSWVSGHGLKRNYVDWSAISPHMKLAVIASEDQLFPDHNGFDWKSMKKAMDRNERRTAAAEQKNKPVRSLSGGSTISQQVAKNVFLWQGQSYLRKGLEAYFTFMIELLWSKQRILEVYLNVIEMGEGIFGAERAANLYFRKSADRLTAQEAALIAACLPSPKRLKVVPATSYMQKRGRQIVLQMNYLRPDPEIQRLLGTAPAKVTRKQK